MCSNQEDVVTVATLAEKDDPESTSAMMRMLIEMEESRKPKILVVADDMSIPEDAAYHLCVLAKRLSSEMLFLSSSIAPGENAAHPPIIDQIREWMGTRRHLTWVPAMGKLDQALWYVTHRIHRVDFAVLVGEENQCLKKNLLMPVFNL
ncbi:hypothetical protein [Desulfovibrio inopinatus]|uniref:hypothetical protein n=1 Tax=Desulfovibrio inopinatus TaxID=102109 RepID=UPI0004061CAF|nr:hypothetical protein [Desulfovibrio inopinatus]